MSAVLEPRQLTKPEVLRQYKHRAAAAMHRMRAAALDMAAAQIDVDAGEDDAGLRLARFDYRCALDAHREAIDNEARLEAELGLGRRGEVLA